MASALLLAACLPAVGGGQRPAGTIATQTQGSKPTMRISFERSGGIAGLRLAVTIDSDTLPEAQAAELKQLVDEARFFDLPARLGPTSPKPDEFTYRVTVEAAGRRHAVETTETAAPANLRPLLEWLARAVRRRAGGVP